MAQTVKRLLTTRETRVRSLGWEDPLEKEIATPVLLPGKSHGRRSVIGYSPWVTKSQTRLSDFTFTFQSVTAKIKEDNDDGALSHAGKKASLNTHWLLELLSTSSYHY